MATQSERIAQMPNKLMEEIARLRTVIADLNKAITERDLEARHLSEMHIELQRATSMLNPIMERASKCQECGVARTPEWQRVKRLILVERLNLSAPEPQKD